MVIPMERWRCVWVPTAIGRVLYDKEMEASRVKHYAPILYKHSTEFNQRAYNQEVYGKPNPHARCYDNALKTAVKHGLRYCEGFMEISSERGLLTIGHGFCVDSDGFVVDTTIGPNQNHMDVRYVGVAIRTDYVQQQAKNNGYVGVLDGHPDGRTNTIYNHSPEVWKP